MLGTECAGPAEYALTNASNVSESSLVVARANVLRETRKKNYARITLRGCGRPPVP